MKFQIISAVCVFLLGFSYPAQSEEIIFAHGAKEGNPRYDAAEVFSSLVRQCSNDKYQVKVAAAASIGDDSETLKSVKAGVIQLTANSQGPLANIVPEVGLLGLPFLFKDLPHAWQVLDGPIGEILDKKANKQGIKILTFWDNGFRNITHVNKHLLSPEDFKNFRIRTPADKSTIDLFQALGSQPAPLEWSELPKALENGIFEGQENPLTNIYYAKLHKLTPYISMTEHKYEATPVVANLNWWMSLAKTEKTCIRNAAQQAGWFQRARNLFENKALEIKMKAEGAKFKTADKQSLIKRSQSVYKLYESKFGDLIKRIKTYNK